MHIFALLNEKEVTLALAQHVLNKRRIRCDGNYPVNLIIHVDAGANPGRKINARIEIEISNDHEQKRIDPESQG